MNNIRFELNKPNKVFSNNELLNDLYIVAQNLNKKSVSIKEYSIHGKYSYQTFKKRFGSWKKALIEAGLEESTRPWGGPLSETSIPEEKIINDLRRVAKLLGKDSITLEDYSKHGEYSTSAVSKRWGGWNKAKEKAGLKIGRVYNSSDEDYFSNLADIWQKLGRQPKYHEISSPLSKLHVSSYERRYGSWRSALEAFVNYINNGNKVYQRKHKQNSVGIDPKKKPDTKTKDKQNRLASKKRASRKANLRLRVRVLERDHYRCVFCGSSPAIKRGVVLHIDHIVPWSKGGETVEDNLQTLCQECNLGKSNL